MLLVFDIGNSDITMGLWKDNAWKVWRIPSRVDQPELFYGIRVRDSFMEASLPTDAVHTIVVSSVVPGLTDKVRNVVRSLFKREPVMLGPGVYEKLPLEGGKRDGPRLPVQDQDCQWARRCEASAGT